MLYNKLKNSSLERFCFSLTREICLSFLRRKILVIYVSPQAFKITTSARRCLIHSGLDPDLSVSTSISIVFIRIPEFTSKFAFVIDNAAQVAVLKKK